MSTAKPHTSDHYDSDDLRPQTSPALRPRVVDLKPSSPTPPPISSHRPQPGPCSIFDTGKQNSKSHPPPDPGNGYLIQTLSEGRFPDSTHQELSRPLQTVYDSDKSPNSGEDSEAEGSVEDEGVRSSDMSPVPSPGLLQELVLRDANKSAIARSGPVDLRSLATDAMDSITGTSAGAPASPRDPTRLGRLQLYEAMDKRLDSKVTMPINIPSINDADLGRRGLQLSPFGHPNSASPLPGPQSLSVSPPGMLGHASSGPLDIKHPRQTNARGVEGLPPIQLGSPPSDTASQETLPSFQSQFGPGSVDPTQRPPSYQNSPPTAGIANRMGSMGSIQGSPPISPASSAPAMSPFQFSPPINGSHRRPSIGYLGGAKPEPHPLDRCSISSHTIDKMSIDSVTNPQQGFACTFEGCTAPPFQTQYLLNSHANVHSSARPHYCPVQGCPRAEGGKGFKRKNEMIRHGLVHESPGYVCPFCPDREHKYPRPDNLQRHVRVHHVDKDKDDVALREVLAQRPDGPNRGRRRRGGA